MAKDQGSTTRVRLMEYTGVLGQGRARLTYQDQTVDVRVPSNIGTMTSAADLLTERMRLAASGGDLHDDESEFRRLLTDEIFEAVQNMDEAELKEWVTQHCSHDPQPIQTKKQARQ